MYKVTHREYDRDGKFVESLTLSWDVKIFAIMDANYALESYNETPNRQKVGPCNISVRGPSGRFIKWRN